MYMLYCIGTRTVNGYDIIIIIISRLGAECKSVNAAAPNGAY